MDILEVIVFAIAIFLFVYLLVLQPHKIKGSSMEPNFADGEYLLTDKLTYRFREPARGEIVVFAAPGTNGDEYIKRIVALPGEKIKITDNRLYVNDQPLREDYLSSELPTKPGTFLREAEEITIPQDHFFVLGDNRTASSDSRAWGLVTKKALSGRAWIVYWPPSKAGLVPKVSYQF